VCACASYEAKWYEFYICFLFLITLAFVLGEGFLLFGNRLKDSEIYLS
jgi:hypothetical protein